MNKFFKSALGHAASMVGRRSRLLGLLPQLTMKLREVNWRDVNAASAKDKFFVLGRLVRAYAVGDYREIPWKTILLVVASILYFLNPLDVVPDVLPFTGLTDDFAVLLWVYNSVSHEIQKFLIWERNNLENP